MRVLLGPLNRRDHRAVVGDLADLDIVVFDRHDADVAFDPAREPLETLWGRLPAGWQPDVLVWWSPEYAALPEGIERCPVPSAAVLGDWNLGVWATAPLLEAFDLVVTDRMGVQLLGPQLGVPVDAWPAFSFDPARHRREPAVERDIDVLFVGNMNHEVQHERAPWLARLARLGRRHRVVLASGVYGDAYGDLLRRARIVWNRGIRGEMNMRAYEAPAAGALLFMETENLEVRDVFSDGLSCVLYDDASLERLIDEHLGTPERLARMADAGWRRVQSETYRDHLARLVGDLGHLRIGPRPFAALPDWRRDYWLGVHALCSADASRSAAALGHLGRALAATPDRGAVAAALGAVAAGLAQSGDGDAQRSLDQAAELLALAVRMHPDDVVSRANLAWVSAARGRGDVAGAEALAARALLHDGQPFALDRVPVPFGFDRFRAAWELASLAPDLETRAAALRPVLTARLCALLAGLEASPEAALDWWTESVEAWPGIAGNVRRLAGTLDAAGHADVAAAAYGRVLELDPFDWDSRQAALALAERRADSATAERLRAEGLELVAALAPATPAAAEAAAR
jgi:tetratricopeptide (TPR) repeat protein